MREEGAGWTASWESQSAGRRPESTDLPHSRIDLPQILAWQVRDIFRFDNHSRIEQDTRESKCLIIYALIFKPPWATVCRKRDGGGSSFTSKRRDRRVTGIRTGLCTFTPRGVDNCL